MKKIKLIIALIVLAFAANGLFGCVTAPKHLKAKQSAVKVSKHGKCATYAGTNHRYNTEGL